MLDEATASAPGQAIPNGHNVEDQFKINKPVLSNVTYRVYCKVERQRVKNVLYEVSGILTDSKRQDVVHATCLALMANPSEVEKQTPPEFYARAVAV